MSGLIRDDHLFTWLNLAKEGIAVARTTNPLEGGPNKAIKEFLRHHRGLSIACQNGGVDWLLYRQTEAAKDPWKFVTPAAWQSSQARTVIKPNIGRVETESLYGTSFSVEDGDGIQRGWGGRSR